MSNSHRAVFLDHSSLDLGDLDLSSLSACFADLQLYPHSTQAQTIERLQGVQVAISNKVPLNAEVFAACPELKLVLVAATGTNPIDLSAARAHGVIVSNCQGYGTPSVAQHTLMLLLALATRLPDYQRDVRSGRWQQAQQFCLLDYPIVELHGKTLGLLGHGELGGAVAKLAEAFGMRVLLGQLPGRPPRADRLSLDELLPQVDALTLRAPFDGQVGQIQAVQRSNVAINAPVLSVVDLSVFEVEIKVPESFARDLAIGMPATLTSAGQPYPGEISAVSPEVVGGEVVTRLRFSDKQPPGLRQNQRLSARILMETRRNVLMVERGPFLEQDGGRQAYVMDGNSAVRRPVQLGVSSLSNIEVLSGLQPGDKVVVSGSDQFGDAERVSIND